MTHGTKNSGHASIYVCSGRTIHTLAELTALITDEPFQTGEEKSAALVPAQPLGGIMARHDGLQYTAPLLHVAEDEGPDGIASESGDAADGPSVELADEGHLVLVLPPGEVITGSMAVGIAGKIDRLAASHRLPLLLTLTGVESISRSARDVFSAARSLAAVAVIGVSPVDRVIANFLLGGEVQPCPTRYFSHGDAALNWLKRYAG